MTPPASLVKALKTYDPALRLWWGAASKQWLIGRRMAPRHPDFVAEMRPPPSARPEDHDRFVCLQAGYLPLFTIPREAGHQTDRVMLALREWDAAAQGGFRAINQRLDAAEEAWLAERTKERQTFVHEATSEAFDRIQWLNGNRVTTSDMADGAETSDAVERHEGFVVRIKKGQHAEVEP